VDVATGTGIIWSNGTSYCSQCLTTESHFDGPNGIAYVSHLNPGTCSEDDTSLGPSDDDFLIVALGASSGRLLRVNVSVAFVEPVVIDVLANSSVSAVDQMVRDLSAYL
jgi:hypothetical protein